MLDYPPPDSDSEIKNALDFLTDGNSPARRAGLL
jgi:hypothetical protein